MSVPFEFLLLFSAVSVASGPVAKFPVSKETTYLTEPLDSQGYVDYEAALNAQLGKGIVPEKNAVALLWRALGTKMDHKEPMPAEFFRLLGIPEPPPKGEYFVDLYPFLKNQPDLDNDEISRIGSDQFYLASERPWKAKDYPHIAAWLKANEKSLALANHAAKLPEYYYPVASRRTKDGSKVLIDSRYPGIGRPRSLAAAWAARAMLAMDEGRMDAAWQDLLGCHRLGRLISRGGDMVSILVGGALEHIAITGELLYLDRAGLNAKQIRDRLKDIHELPPMVAHADALALGERYNFLDEVQRAHRGGPDAIAESIEMDIALRRRDSADRAAVRKLSAAEKKALADLDWEIVLRTINRHYDAALRVVRIEDRSAREKEFNRMEKQLSEKKAPPPEALLASLGPNGSSKTASELYGELMAELQFGAVHYWQGAVDRLEQTRRNHNVAFALALYEREHCRYPMKLDELVPKYQPDIPRDLFSGQPLQYRPMEKGFLLYSVGKNGIDDGGQASLLDRPPGDDLAVRMPVPELKFDE